MRGKKKQVTSNSNHSKVNAWDKNVNMRLWKYKIIFNLILTFTFYDNFYWETDAIILFKYLFKKKILTRKI